jgi:hypothetical protein
MMQRLIHPLMIVGGALAICLAGPLPRAAAVEGEACESEPTDQQIRYGDLINCAIGQIGDDDVFRFSGGSGETIRLQISNLTGGARACFRLFDPNGEPFDLGVCANNGRDYLLVQTGTHTVVIAEDDSNSAVDYAVALERVDPPSQAAFPIDFNQVIDDEVNGIGDLDLFFFSGEVGDTISVRISNRSAGARACFRVYTPDGAPIDLGVCANNSRVYVLEQSGRHSIVVAEDDGNATVEFALGLTCVAGICPDADLPAVSGCIARHGSPFVSRRVRLLQDNEATQRTLTDVRGCYEFRRVVRGKRFQVRIASPRRPQ